MDWSVGGDGDGYVTPVSECVKCREVAWKEGANTVVEVPVLKILSTSFTSIFFTSQDLGRFHSDGPEIRLQHTWPQMTAHAQVMLLAISLLCR